MIGISTEDAIAIRDFLWLFADVSNDIAPSVVEHAKALKVKLEYAIEDADELTNRLTRAALDFYQGAESPDANAWDSVFTALAERNLKELREVCEDYGIKE